MLRGCFPFPLWSAVPFFPVTVHFWCGDEEFPASGKALVDAAAEHYLTLEAAGGACSSAVQANIRMWKHATAEK